MHNAFHEISSVDLQYRSNSNQILGTNMFTIIPGENFGTKEDKILVVGAHWDTVDGSSGFDDNASGVAAILELGRALSMGECSLKYTVILVTFDLEEHGTQGSLAFVQDFLVDMVLKPMGFPGFQVRSAQTPYDTGRLKE